MVYLELKEEVEVVTMVLAAMETGKKLETVTYLNAKVSNSPTHYNLQKEA